VTSPTLHTRVVDVAVQISSSKSSTVLPEGILKVTFTPLAVTSPTFVNLYLALITSELAVSLYLISPSSVGKTAALDAEAAAALDALLSKDFETVSRFLDTDLVSEAVLGTLTHLLLLLQTPTSPSDLVQEESTGLATLSTQA